MIEAAGRWGKRKMSQKLVKVSQGAENETCDVVWTEVRLTEEMTI